MPPHLPASHLLVSSLRSGSADPQQGTGKRKAAIDRPVELPENYFGSNKRTKQTSLEGMFGHASSSTASSSEAGSSSSAHGSTGGSNSQPIVVDVDAKTARMSPAVAATSGKAAIKPTVTPTQSGVVDTVLTEMMAAKQQQRVAAEEMRARVPREVAELMDTHITVNRSLAAAAGVPLPPHMQAPPAPTALPPTPPPEGGLQTAPRAEVCQAAPLVEAPALTPTVTLDVAPNVAPNVVPDVAPMSLLESMVQLPELPEDFYLTRLGSMEANNKLGTVPAPMLAPLLDIAIAESEATSLARLHRKWVERGTALKVITMPAPITNPTLALTRVPSKMDYLYAMPGQSVEVPCPSSACPLCVCTVPLFC